jgi:hypothetical protein
MVLFYITSNENIGLFDKPCNDNSVVVKQLSGTFDLSQFIINDTSDISCCHYLAIDLSCLSDSDDSIINAIVGIKSMYDIRIIILAAGYENSNPLLGRIFAEGIYNIITATRTNQQQEKISKCLTGGMQYKDSIKYRLQSDYIPTQQKQKSKHANSKVIIQKQSIRQTISIGICGSLHRIGTTKQALHITKFLNENGYTACYIENNGHGHMDTLDGFYNIDKSEASYITIDGIDVFPKFDMGSILQGGYDFLIYDNGLFDESDKQKFLEFDVKIICSGTTSWEAPHANTIYSDIGNYNHIHFIFSFAPIDLRSEILIYMDKFKSKTYFADYAPVIVDGVTNSKIYKRIFKEYIHEKSQPMQSKKGFWRK